MINKSIKLIDNPSTNGRDDKFMTITVDLDKIIQSWRHSLFSFEWLLPDGSVRSPDEMVEKERVKYESVRQKIQTKPPIHQPILGIGVMDNVEIGSARENLLTLYTQNIKSLTVHIPKSDEKEFTPFLFK